MENDIILQTTRAALGLAETGTDFNSEVMLHIRAALSILNQNGIGVEDLVIDNTTTWGAFKNVAQLNGNKHFALVPTFVFTKTKILFDPPPPSNVPFYDGYIQELLWRLRIAYEEDNNAAII